ncbi:MAG: hypothetical protein H0V82_10375 [Candidatus Protochlamydia sp.]|nr:hypothetical protein [Candidatus Protochlamydia sp.]
MYKTIIMAIFAILMVVVIFLATNLKDAYKTLPGTITDELKIVPYSDWNEFTPKTGLFKVRLPSTPQFANETVNIPGTDLKRLYEMYAAEKINGAVFMVSVITYPPSFPITNNQELLHEVIDELVASNTNNRLLETRDGEFKSHPNVDFHMVNKEYDIEGKAFLVGKIMYVLTYVVKNTDYDTNDYQYFLNSFELTTKS